MTITDEMINGILRDMGVEPNKPARWKTHIHKFIDQSTGKVYRTMKDGYICSKCGKHSYYKKSVCDGCNSRMPKESEVAKRREDIEKSRVDCSTPSVTDSKGDTE